MHSRDVLAALRADCGSKSPRREATSNSDPLKAGRVTVPHPRRDLPIGTLRSIERQARIKLR